MQLYGASRNALPLVDSGPAPPAGFAWVLVHDAPEPRSSDRVKSGEFSYSAMIHIVTAHFNAPEWVRIQRRALDRHVAEPFMLYAVCEGVAESDLELIDVVISAVGQHAGKLNLMAWHVLQSADDDDLLVFLDADAFPIAPLALRLRELLKDSYVVAVRRSEIGYPQPHPSFCATTVGRWRILQGDWSPGHCWENPYYLRPDRRRLVTDVGGNLLAMLQHQGLPWHALERTNRLNLHPLLFGVYGDLIYHHGGGSGFVASAPDLVNAPFAGRGQNRLSKSVYGRLHRKWLRRTARRLNELQDSVRVDIERDENSVMRFLDGEDVPSS